MAGVNFILKFKNTFMKKIFFLLLLPVAFTTRAQNDKTPTLKSILLEQLKSTHNSEEWFVPANIAIEGLTPEQANWKDSSENHSIAQLTTHLIFWDEQTLAKFKGENPAAFNGDNKETFSPVDKDTWAATVKKLDSVLTELEKAVEAADDAKLMSWYSTVAHIGTHNAYHIGQIIYIRKMKGWWDDNKGVKA
jgi:DinB superfamily